MTSPSRARTALTALAAVGAVGVATATWGIGIERYLFTLRRHVVPILNPGSPQVRILHLSDAHMAPWQHRKQEWIAQLARLKPDLVVNTGDNLGHIDGLSGVRAALSPFRGIPGVFVHGSNDVSGPSPRNPLAYFLGPSRTKNREVALDTPALDAFLSSDLGWTNLNNDAARLRVAGHEIDLFGVSDAHRGWEDLDVLPGRLAEVRADVAPADLTLGVTHAPYRHVLDAYTEMGADMLFAGHTHGGQVRVPFYGALVANCDIPLRQARGLSTWRVPGSRGIPLNVSAGLGHSIFAPVRFSCPPEASLLTLVPRVD